MGQLSDLTEGIMKHLTCVYIPIANPTIRNMQTNCGSRIQREDSAPWVPCLPLDTNGSCGVCTITRRSMRVSFVIYELLETVFHYICIYIYIIFFS